MAVACGKAGVGQSVALGARGDGAGTRGALDAEHIDMPRFDPPPIHIGADRLYVGPCVEEIHLWRMGNVVSRTTLTYDDRGLLVEVQVDKRVEGVRGLDGRPETVRLMTYDKKERLVSEDKENFDSDNSAWWNTRTLIAYDSAGRIKTKTHDRQVDGVVDYTTKYLYKKGGALVVEETRSNADKRLFCRSTRIHDKKGRLLRQEEDSDADGQPDSLWFFTYDDDGNVVMEENDRDADGVVDTVTRRVYDDAGRLLQEQTDLDGNGSPDLTTTYSYDEFGNVLSKTTDQARTIYLYDCWK
jgi:hypothetical protein